MSSQWPLFINHEQNNCANHLYKTFMQAVAFNSMRQFMQ